MVFHIFRGFNPRLTGAPEQAIHAGPKIETIALLGADYRGQHLALKVAEGDHVEIGDMLFTDRTYPQITFVSPLAGTVSSIGYGARRTLSTLVIKRDDKPIQTGGDVHAVDVKTPDAFRDTLLARGLWPAFRTRPFGRMPLPTSQPEAIFVTATDTNPHAPDPRIVIAQNPDFFRIGVESLRMLTDGVVYVCQPPGDDLIPDNKDQIESATFSGAHPAGLAGTHIHRLHPVNNGNQVWTIGYQDVIAIGHLLETGRYMAERTIALAGSRAAHPRLIRTHLGASIAELTKNQAVDVKMGTPSRVLSGPFLSGREGAYLGRFHLQVSIVDAPSISSKPSFMPRIFRNQRNDEARPLIPTAALERAMLFDIPPVPLMRALSVGDTEAAAKLGCVELLEEDVALLSSLCTSGADYGSLLRHVLDTLEAEI